MHGRAAVHLLPDDRPDPAFLDEITSGGNSSESQKGWQQEWQRDSPRTAEITGAAQIDR